MTLTVGLRYPAGDMNHSDVSPVLGDVPATPLKSNSVNKWLQALDSFDQNKPEEALEIFSQITPTNSKVVYNMASVYSILGNYFDAITYFKRATSFDSYMAISYFQIGVSNFLSGTYGEAADAFNTALKLLRGNSVVNYQQLGLDYKLYSCEIVYNRALSYIYSGALSTGILDLEFAAKERKYISEHNIIDEALEHFTQMEKIQNRRKNSNALSLEDLGNKLPNLPGALDKKKQRFSIVNPPHKLNFGSSPNSPTSDGFDLCLGKKEEDEVDFEQPKEMAYSLFSVPQGSLFRLTELKVCSILNDKKLNEIITSGRGHVTFKSGSALAKTISDTAAATAISNSTAVLGSVKGRSISNDKPTMSRDGGKVYEGEGVKLKMQNGGFGFGSAKSNLPPGPTKTVGPLTPPVSRGANKTQSSSSTSSSHQTSSTSNTSGVITPPISPELPVGDKEKEEEEAKTPVVTAAATIKSCASSSYTTPAAEHSEFYASGPNTSTESLGKPKPSAYHSEYTNLVEPGFHFKTPSSVKSTSSDLEIHTTPRSTSRTQIHNVPSPLGLYLESNLSASASQSKLSDKSENSLFDNASSLMDSELYDHEFSPDLSTLTLGKPYGNVHISKGSVVDKGVSYKTLNPAHYGSLAPPSTMAQVSGDLGPISATTSKGESSKPASSSYPTGINAPSSASIKVKIFCAKETRAIKISSGISFRDFKARIAQKVQSKELEDSPILSSITNNMIIRGKDEDGDLVLIVDQEDLDVAISEALSHSKSSPKINVYVENVFDAEI